MGSTIVRQNREDQPAASNQDVDLKVDLAGVSDIGQKRSANQDHFLIANMQRLLTIEATNVPHDQCDELYGNQTGRLLVVADGMGGHAAGELASSTAIQSCARYVLDMMHWFLKLSAHNEEEFQEELGDCLKSIQRTIWSSGTGSRQGMGTTVTMAYVLWPKMFVVHAGDSRCYLHRDKELKQLTTDHTLAERLVQDGALSREEAETSRWRHVLWNCVGGDEKTVRPEVFRVTLQSGDTVLLCSDGVTGMIDDREIAYVLNSQKRSEAAVNDLTRRANAAGGNDNITSVVARFKTTGQAPQQEECFQTELADTDVIETGK